MKTQWFTWLPSMTLKIIGNPTIAPASFAVLEITEPAVAAAILTPMSVALKSSLQETEGSKRWIQSTRHGL